MQIEGWVSTWVNYLRSPHDDRVKLYTPASVDEEQQLPNLPAPFPPPGTNSQDANTRALEPL